VKCSPLFNIRYDARFSDVPAFVAATFELTMSGVSNIKDNWQYE